jgi:phage terminase Nu1 subunit (DNA packaging protein)
MSENSNPILMTQAQYARHRGKSPQYINKLAKAAILVMRGRLVDAVASDAVLDDKPEPLPSGQQPTSFAQARLARELFAAKLKKLEYETRSGKLVPADEVSIQWYTLGREIRDRLLGMPSKLTPQLAAETDVRRVLEILDAEVTLALKGLAEEIRSGRA